MPTELSAVSLLPANPGSPDWWVDQLWKRLCDQAEEAAYYDDYYSGEHPLPWLAPEAREEFRRILWMARTNVMGLVCDSQVERIKIEGFRFGEENKGDAETWDIYQYNNMDAETPQALLESSIAGQSFFFVAPNPDRPDKPYWGTETAVDAIVAYEPGSSRRIRKAGMKVWFDEWTGYRNAALYVRYKLTNGDVDVRVYKYVARKTVDGAKPRWERRTVTGEDWGDSARMDELPLVPIPNNPRKKSGGRSELADVTDSQDRINKTLADRLIASDYGSFPAKWATAWPDEDEEGNPNTIAFGRNRMTTTDVAETKFGQFTAESLSQYSEAKREDVKDIASRTRTPAQYLLGDMSNVNGETLKASESGLIAKIGMRMLHIGEAAEHAARLARKLAGLSGENDYRMETIFANPEFRTEGEVTDATVKKLQSGIATRRQARVDVGYSETTIRAMEADDLKDAIHPAVANALREVRTGPSADQAPTISS